MENKEEEILTKVKSLEEEITKLRTENENLVKEKQEITNEYASYRLANTQRRDTPKEKKEEPIEFDFDF